MMGKDELSRIREEHEVMDTWRKYSRHVVADFLEACAICGIVREKEHLARCQWCEDVYFCKEGTCSQQHHAEKHPAVAFWTW
jgi:regulator of sigma D